MNKQFKNRAIAIFEGVQIRRHWDGEKEFWDFSVIDVVRVLTGSVDAGAYWRKLKQRLKEDGSEIVTKCHELKFMAKDGKYYASDSADTEVMLHLIQSIPSPNAEPFKLWLARVGYERLEETADPELAIDRALKTYLQKGYSHEWTGMTTKEYKKLKDLKKENLRDNMTNLELVLNMLAEQLLRKFPKNANRKIWRKIKLWHAKAEAWQATRAKT